MRITEVITKKFVDVNKLFWFELYEMCGVQSVDNGTQFFALYVKFFLQRLDNLHCLK